ncbi:MAG: hypothetical protein ACOC85_03830 [Thermoplasmatota archaeon]
MYITTSEGQDQELSNSEQYMTVFFLFDSVIENSEIHSQAAVELFKKIQLESLQ